MIRCYTFADSDTTEAVLKGLGFKMVKSYPFPVYQDGRGVTLKYDDRMFNLYGGWEATAPSPLDPNVHVMLGYGFGQAVWDEERRTLTGLLNAVDRLCRVSSDDVLGQYPLTRNGVTYQTPDDNHGVSYGPAWVGQTYTHSRETIIEMATLMAAGFAVKPTGFHQPCRRPTGRYTLKIYTWGAMMGVNPEVRTSDHDTPAEAVAHLDAQTEPYAYANLVMNIWSGESPVNFDGRPVYSGKWESRKGTNGLHPDLVELKRDWPLLVREVNRIHNRDGGGTVDIAGTLLDSRHPNVIGYAETLASAAYDAEHGKSHVSRELPEWLS